MAHILLIGAGFSRNWGGWLAAEAFEYLLGCKEIQDNPSLGILLWQHKESGGFEAALAAVQAQGRGYGKDELAALQAAVIRMFDDMNNGYLGLTNGLEFNSQVGFLVREMLVRFDAIFSLNQDLLLEYHYINDNISLCGARKWDAAYLPGVRRTQPAGMLYGPQARREVQWIVGDEHFERPLRQQPIYKLHGSTQWVDQNGSDLLVIGGAKTATISRTPLLGQYLRDFEARLSQPGARLMIIGYGFADGHINEIIQKTAQNGLRCFIIDPLGVDVANPTRNVPVRVANPMENLIIGASRRTLREIFSGDRVEYAKIMRFFEA